MKALAFFVVFFTNSLWAIVISKEEIQNNKQHVVLYHLNPNINRWLIIESSGASSWIYHFENPEPKNKISLSSLGIKILTSNNKILNCALWSNTASINTIDLSDEKRTFFPICDKNLYIRLKRDSNTQLSWTEWGTKFLRQTEPTFGENIINSIKPFLVEFNSEKAQEQSILQKLGIKSENPNDDDAPKPYALSARPGEILIASEHNLGFNLEALQIEYGKWYESSMHKGVYAGLFAPRYLNPDLLPRKNVYPLLKSEMNAIIYLVAYDLRKYSLQFVSGTNEPGFSIPENTTQLEAHLQENLVAIGSIPTYKLENAIGVFIGGFKLQHSTIQDGPLKGKTYGAIENGVVIQKMSEGLATIYTEKSGNIKIANWPKKDDPNFLAFEQNVVSARQNGVLLLENGEPGSLVKDWRGGNWSASANGMRITLRSGICITKDRRHLLFMAFSLATPSAMADVMQAYQCDAGMGLDMNALMYMHNAIYKMNTKTGISVEYLDKEMLYPPDLKLHRFIMDNNYRDFFYVEKK